MGIGVGRRIRGVVGRRIRGVVGRRVGCGLRIVLASEIKIVVFVAADRGVCISSHDGEIFRV